MMIGQHLQIPAFLVYSEGAYIPLQSCEIAQTPGRERLGRIWPSPYAGQRVIRSVLWCSASADLGGRTEYVVPLVLLTS